MNVLATDVIKFSPAPISSLDLITKLDGLSKMLFVFAGLAIIILLIILLNLRSLLKKELEKSNWRNSRGLRLTTRKLTTRRLLKDYARKVVS